ncbi:glycoside hydrolase family 125 protein [Curtobacterium flaccumfaciens pv. oortii]|uniref:glycoside hydrolase family 125 protein n=1 Tax=Curtobacterium flaccumfaciens TaxID=2035 RepID=UPI001BDDF57B|nr:glycoside hydrolase family 125 protein [Curtobacterium flaccumfaciens]MBT1623155.1 glycoside hydrolase family 125 protein [Curtobacterium flaccumfaciens pv. oortii]
MGVVTQTQLEEITSTLVAAADRVRAAVGTEVGDRVERALVRTLRDTISLDDDGAFVITGDIPAMWLRDSTTQMTPYLRFVAEDPALAELLWAVVRRQFRLIEHDPYANSFNREPNGAHYDADDRNADPLVWEQKYEVDSLAYPVTFAHALWRATGSTAVLDERAHRVFRTIVAQWRAEQDHDASAYRFVRDGAIPTETLARDGRGTPVAVTGMTWCGFRPSDDACTYGYNVPANLFAAEALLAVAAIARDVWSDTGLADDADVLRASIQDGVRQHGVVPGPAGEDVYAYEVDGLGGVLCMDDANTPSLLSLPLSAPSVLDHSVWAATRDFVLSPANPYWFSGTAAAGVGSPHTLPQRVWPIALAVEGLVSGSPARRRELLDVLVATDGGTGDMHESFDVEDPAQFSRPWFSWADAMFCELALAAAED